MNVLPGDEIECGEGSMRGHGTAACSSSSSLVVRSSVAGRVERVNRLVGVRCWRGRFRGEVGEVALGRVAELAARRWRVDVGSPQLAALALSSINLPGGVLRRRNDLDALNMRQHFVEGDLVVCEVQAVHSDGSLALHTRSLRYGKLRGGTLVCLDPSLVARSSSAFCESSGLVVIVGANGFVWCGPSLPPLPAREDLSEVPEELEKQQALLLLQAGADPALRRRIAAVSALARRAAALARPVTAQRLVRMLNALVAADLAPEHLRDDFFD